METLLSYLTANWMDVLGTLLGILYLYLEIKESLWMWVVGSLMPVIYIFVLYRAGVYADCCMEVYYLFAGLYGLLCWLRGIKRADGKRSLPISDTPRRLWLPLTGVALLLWAVMTFVLTHYTNSTVPGIDAFTTALSIVGLWMLSRKYTHQWLVWLVVDAISVGLYIYKGIYGRAFLYALYTFIAFYGYRSWKTKMRRG